MKIFLFFLLGFLFLIIVFRKKIIKTLLNGEKNKFVLIANLIFGVSESTMNVVKKSFSEKEIDEIDMKKIVINISRYLSKEIFDIISDEKVIIYTKHLIQNKYYSDFKPEEVEKIFNSECDLLLFLQNLEEEDSFVEKIYDVLEVRKNFLLDSFNLIIKEFGSIDNASSSDITEVIEKVISKK